MTHDDAKRVAKIISYADGGCSVCVALLAKDCQEAWPEHDWAKLVAESGGGDPLLTISEELIRATWEGRD